MKGAGKSNLLALLVEQFRRYFLPQLIIDTEREYQSLLTLLPHGVLATANRCPESFDILHHGLQVILDMQSWETDEAAARALCRLIEELFAATTALAPQERVPCIIHLDEAAYWLPQDAVTYFSKEARKALSDAFHKLASRGRKQGLTPFLYTQSISEIAKSVIRQAGIKVLMRQTLDIDLTRYCQFIQGATSRTRQAIQAYPSGKAIVILPDGSQHRVQFYPRESAHVSQTPQAQAALVKFAALDLDVSALPMRDLTSETPTQSTHVKHASRPPTAIERIHAFLAANPTLRVMDLMKLAECSESQASRARNAYFVSHPGQDTDAQYTAKPKTASARVREYLDADPSLRPIDLVKLVGCDQALAARVRQVYFAAHPEQEAQAQQVQRPRPMTKGEQRIRALLAENPQYTPSQIARRINYSLNAFRKLLARIQEADVVSRQELTLCS